MTHYPSHGGHKFSPDPARDILFIIQDEMPDIAAAFHGWWVMLGGLLLNMKPEVQDGISPLPLQTPATCCSIICAPTPDQHTSARMINITRLSQRTWDLSVHLGASDDINRVLQCVKKAGGTFSGWKMTFVSQKLPSCGPPLQLWRTVSRGLEGSRDPGLGRTAILSWKSHGFLSMWCRTNLVKDFAMCARPLVILTRRKWIFPGAQNRKIHGGLEAGDHYSPCFGQ